MSTSPAERARELVRTGLELHGIKPRQLSTRLNLNQTYFQQYLKYGKPRWLPEAVRQAVAEILNVDEALLRQTDMRTNTHADVKGLAIKVKNAQGVKETHMPGAITRIIQEYKRLDPADRATTRLAMDGVDSQEGALEEPARHRPTGKTGA